ncbi:MAG: hypothetical protein II794_06535, partial [Oscillospiraceae bacterium]|nr:hypothetical protein [Oscillospiraceae bacterium]
KAITAEAVWDASNKRMSDWTAMKGTIKGRISDYLYKKTKRSPMVLPVIMDI